MPKKPTEHYVDNQRFLKELKVYRIALMKTRKAKTEPPKVPEYIGECFLKIAQHLSFKPNFMGYTFRDDMCSDGVENCLVYIHNFDPSKSSNPFGYFTQIIYYAFLRRIQREKKHTYIKYKLTEKALIDGSLYESPEGGPSLQQDNTQINFDNVQDFINRYDEYAVKRRERRRRGKKTE